MMRKIEFKNNKKQTLRGFIHEPKKYDTAIIVMHGFPGRCRSKRIKNTCNDLQKIGYLSMRFDFSGTNFSDGKFEDKLMSQEVKEIKYAIDFLKKNYKFRKLILYGHSTGAIDAALYAYKDKRINKLILSGAISALNNAARYDFSDEQIKDFWTKGYVIYKNKDYWTYNKRIKKAFYDEFFKLNIPLAMKKYRRPLLIVHGDKDDAVPLEEGKKLFENSNKPKKLVVIKDCNHDFSKPSWRKQLIKEIHKFVRSK